MPATAVTSVASFSVVLAEVFAAVGLSTTVPAAAVTLARLLKNAQTSSPTAGSGGTATTPIDASVMSGLMEALNTLPTTGPLKPADLEKLLRAVSLSLPSLDLLLPKTAKIHAEFSFEGREKVSGGAEAGVAVDVVSVKAGYSAMYEMKSSNRITLDINFESVNVAL